MSPSDLSPYVAAVVLLGAFLVVQIRRDSKRRAAASAELKEKFFPQFIAALRDVEAKLGEEPIGEGYTQLMNQGWKSSMLRDFHRYYSREDEIFTNIKRKLEAYESDVQKFKQTGDSRLREKLGKENKEIREDLSNFAGRLERLETLPPP